MSADTSVLVIDDGELDEVCALLDQLGADFERLSGTSARIPIPHPKTLLICSDASARSLRIQRAVNGSIPRPTWIVFVSSEAASHRSMLRSAGFDFLVRRPVHPAALRVLISRALFRGAESRRAPRVACGHPVTFKTGFWRQKAMMVDLSPRGCRLLVQKPVKEKSEINIQLPKQLTGARELDLLGHVVRVAPASAECGREGETTVGVRFAPVEGVTWDQLRAVLSERVLGPAVLPAKLVRAPGSAHVRAVRELAKPAPPAPSAEPVRPRRSERRALYPKKLTAMDGNSAYMVMCRDLSAGGMRIEPVEGLEVGSHLDLAIQLSARDEPFMVEASVLRDDGELGLALKFEWIEPEPRERLTAVLERLPEIEALQDDAQSQGTILAQRLPEQR